MLNLKAILTITGIVLTVVGVFIDNWKVAVVGNSVAISAVLIP